MARRSTPGGRRRRPSDLELVDGARNGDREALAYLDYLTASLPYRLLKTPHVLVVGAGGGHDVLLARYQGAAAIDAVELEHAQLRTRECPLGSGAGYGVPLELDRVYQGDMAGRRWLIQPFFHLEPGNASATFDVSVLSAIDTRGGVVFVEPRTGEKEEGEKNAEAKKDEI